MRDTSRRACHHGHHALQELHGARSDALGKHMDLMRAEKASLAAELGQAQAECADLRAEIEHLHGLCIAAEASTDAISKVSVDSQRSPSHEIRWVGWHICFLIGLAY